MMQLNPIQTRKAVETAMMARVAMMIWGAPGIGKSQIMAQIADDLGAEFIDIRLSQYDSVDLRGIPSVDRDTGLTSWNPPTTLPFKGNPAFDNAANKDRPIILFLDELLQAIPAVQAVAFQLVLDGKVGEHTLLPNVRVVAASNRDTDRAGTNRMLSPLANRFTHVEMVPALDAWCDWAWDNAIDPRLVAFIRFRPDLLSTFDPAKGEKAFASPRTWAFLDRYLKLDPGYAVLTGLAHGTVGTGPATEFISFMDVWGSMPDIDDILARPDKAPVPSKDKPATMFAVSAALSARAEKKTIDAIVIYLKRMPAEYAVRCIKDSVRRDQSVASSKAFIQFATEYSNLMLA